MNAPPAWPLALTTRVQEAFTSERAVRPRPLLADIQSLPTDHRGRGFRLMILRTFTVETALDFVTLALACVPLRAEVRLGPLDVIEQELAEPTSDTGNWAPDGILVLWRLEELDPALASEGAGWSPAARLAAGDAVIARIQALAANRTVSAPLFLSTVPPLGEQPTDLVDSADVDGVLSTIYRINQFIRATCAAQTGLYLFDFAGWANKVGSIAFDRRLDLFARQPLAAGAIPSFAAVIARTLAPLVTPRAKVLALDLDNTLWAGVLGEDGLGGVECGHSYPGSAHREIQRSALALRGQGVLLVLLTKNNPDEVELALATHPDLLLRRAHFAAVRANWKPKHENLLDVATELGLGTDAFVFLDDQAFERDQMRFHAREVHVLEMEGEPFEMLTALRTTHRFDALSLGAEDRARADDYALRSERQAPAGDATDFLQSLGLSATIVPVSDTNLDRVVQLLGKTNQFNATTRRHGEADVRAMLSRGAITLAGSLADRFGDQGLVAVLLAEPHENILKVDTFLMSCRVLGRGLEQLMWCRLLELAMQRGFSAIHAEYVRTPKNELVAELFGRLGMTEISRDAERHAYACPLPAPVAFPGWISLRPP